MHDCFFTPTEIATSLVQYYRGAPPEFVADFAAGRGELLCAAESMWPEAKFIATDIDASLVRRLRRERPTWEVGRCDFLDRHSQSRVAALKKLKAQCKLVLLNPPFSSRGGRYWLVRHGETVLRCSISLAFVINALRYLCRRGELIAILPAGALECEKNELAWSHLKSHYAVEVVAFHKRDTFSGCRPLTAIVRVSEGVSDKLAIASDGRRDCKPITVALVRGNLPMFRALDENVEKGLHVVHTTNLKMNSVTLDGIRNCSHRRVLKGPAVLLPRVGLPSDQKVAVYSSNSQIVLSDCVYGLECETKESAVGVKERLLGNWAFVAAAYSGTGAPYITVKKLSNVLLSLNILRKA